jgi:hypothetical protein
MTFLTAHNTTPRAIPTRQRSLEECYALSIEDAKNVLSNRLSLCRTLNFNEKVVVQRLGESIIEGDLAKLQRSLSGLTNHCGRWHQIINVVRAELRTAAVQILALEIVQYRPAPALDEREIGVFSMHHTSLDRLLVLSTNERFGASVYGRLGNDVEELNESPQALLKSMARETALSLAQSSPLLCLR